MINHTYINQADLLLQVIPHIATEKINNAFAFLF